MKIEINTEELLTPFQAAIALNVGYATIYRRIKTGDLICIKLAGRTFIPKHEVERAKKLAMR